MRRIIEKCYSLMFDNREKSDSDDALPERSLTDKAVVFYIALTVTLVILYFIVKDIIKNVQGG